MIPRPRRWKLFSCLIAAFSLSPMAYALRAPSPEFIGELGLAGMSQKSGTTYLELSEQAFEQFGKIDAPFLVLNEGARPALQYREDFEAFCLDGDSADVVSWVTAKDSTVKLSFSCVLESESPKIRERLFVFSFRKGDLVDIQVAAADLVGKSKVRGNLPSANKWAPSNPTDQAIVAVSGAMVSGGLSASQNSGQFQPKDIASREAGAGALIAGLGAAVSHYVFNMAPSASALSGGALTIALADINDSLPDPMTGQPRRKLERKDSNGGLGPISVHFTFKF